MNKPGADRRKRWIRRLKPVLSIIFFIGIPALLVYMLRDVDWQEVWQSLRSYDPWILAAGVGIAAVSYVTFACYDLLGRYYTGHKLSVPKTLGIAFVCYAFNLNLGAWVGGMALRYRLYTRMGLDPITVTRIFSVALLANWVGYMLLAGTVFSLRLVDLPEDWAIGATALQFIGFALIAVSLGYLAACKFSRKRTWMVRGNEIVLPSLRFALVQVCNGAVNWSLMAALIYLLLPEEAFYPSVLAILLVSSIAGVVTHIPGGLGVLEAVFVSMLQHKIPTGALLAALIGYRAIYFLLPLAMATVAYFLMEKVARDQHENVMPDRNHSKDSEASRVGAQNESA